MYDSEVSVIQCSTKSNSVWKDILKELQVACEKHDVKNGTLLFSGSRTGMIPMDICRKDNSERFSRNIWMKNVSLR